MDRQSASKTAKTPSTFQACSFFLNPFLEFCFSTPTFSSIILFHKFVQTFDNLKIPARHCFGTRNTLNKVICLSISCNGNQPWIFAHSNAAASLHFLHCRGLLAHDSLETAAVSTIPCLPQQQSCKKFPSCGHVDRNRNSS